MSSTIPILQHLLTPRTGMCIILKQVQENILRMILLQREHVIKEQEMQYGYQKNRITYLLCENDRQACTHFYMIAKPNGLLLILLTYSISYFLQKNVSDFCFVRLSSFFAHNLFTNFQYHKIIKNNNRFLIDFFILSSLQKPALCRFLFLDWTGLLILNDFLYLIQFHI